ncbi:MAG: glycosyltransferase family 2 protein [Campylobacterales bacterium]|nr:glycosyltransferase family 2 protein [Sphingobacteriaceae bacterium]MBY0540661.1 glycosyltransferase family 2 protein [Campylobacterales bacterium]
MHNLDIVIVNWNAGEQLLNCITSIQNSVFSGFVLDRIIVVDNASFDNSLSLLPQWEKLSIIKSSSNLGFGKACNLGAKQSTGNLVLFLNPDTQLMPDSLDQAISKFIAINSTSKYGVLGVQLRYENGAIQKSCANFFTLSRYISESLGFSKFFPNSGIHQVNFSHNESRYVEHVIGAFYLMNKEVFNSVGGFDEDYFVYFEDLDLSYRLYKLGYKSYFYTGTHVMHVGGGCSQQIKATRLFYVLHSKLPSTDNACSMPQAASR